VVHRIGLYLYFYAFFRREKQHSLHIQHRNAI